ncbi:response regulator transcription factor [bacterium]|nr:response regulator transcription factor [bacterium]
MSGKIKILVVDDHKSIKDGLKFFIEPEADIEFCGSAGNIQDALVLMDSKQPDIAIVDLSLQSEHGLNLIKDCKIQFPEISIIVFSMHDETIYADRSLHAGAKGYIMKSESLEKVVEGIRAVYSGKTFFSDSVKNQILQKKFFEYDNGSVLPVSNLSDRELEVFTLIGHGLRPRQIVDRLNMSSRTVHSHCRNIRIKMNLVDMNALIESASEWVKVNDPLN